MRMREEPVTEISREAFEALVHRSGLALSTREIDELRSAWPLLQPLLDRVRGTRRDRSVQPALVFRPDAYAGEDTP